MRTKERTDRPYTYIYIQHVYIPSKIAGGQSETARIDSPFAGCDYYRARGGLGEKRSPESCLESEEETREEA